MRRIELVTNGGDPRSSSQARQHLAFVEIAPFVSARMPDVVIWGERCFRRETRPDHLKRESADAWWYVECFAVASLTPSPGLPAEPPPATEETFFCRRRGEIGVQITSGPDCWHRVGQDRCCSYCGSLHPDDALAIATEAATPESGNRVEFTDKSYKVYVQRAGVRNASEGGIEFYAAHLPTDELSERRLQEALRAGAGATHDRWMARHGRR